MKTLVVIVGPTGIGKTDLSLDVATALSAEIISCDSRQMYRELVIGTAAPDFDQLTRVKHHFIGNLSIHDYYNASNFEFETLELLTRLFETSNYAVMVGGSGLYADAVIKGIDDLPAVDQEIRKTIMDRLEVEGAEILRRELRRVDPEYYNSSDIYNTKRVMKALEVYFQTGQKYSSFRTAEVKQRPFNIVTIGLEMDRDTLYERINLRVDKMLEAGLLDEVRQFYPYKQYNSLNTVGYKEIFGYFDGEYDLEEAIRLIKRNSRHYAKRQLTWFKRDKSIYWFHPSQFDEIVKTIRNNSV